MEAHTARYVAVLRQGWGRAGPEQPGTRVPCAESDNRARDRQPGRAFPSTGVSLHSTWQARPMAAFLPASVIVESLPGIILV